MHIEAYETVQSSPMRQLPPACWPMCRAPADFKVYWGASGAVDSVIDVTHQLPVPFATNIRASWGILNDSSFTNTAAGATRDENNGLLTWTDIACVDPAPAAYGGCTGTPPAFLMNHARLSPVHVRRLDVRRLGRAHRDRQRLHLLHRGAVLRDADGGPARRGHRLERATYAGSVTRRRRARTRSAPQDPAGGRARLTLKIVSRRPWRRRRRPTTVFAKIHTVPDPYYVTNSLETSANTQGPRFVNLPTQAIIRIYSVSGILVRVLTHNDPTGGG